MSNNEKNISTPIQDMIADAQKDKTWGPILGSVIIVILMIIGALYFFGSIISQKNEEIKTLQGLEELKKEEVIIQTIKQSDSDEIKDIEKDIQETEFELFDELFLELEKEF